MTAAAPVTSARDPLPFHLVDAATLTALVSFEDAIAIIAAAMVRLSAGDVVAPARWTEPVAPDGMLGLMPGVDAALGCFGVKALSLYEREARGGLPSHQGVMLLFDRETGAPRAAIDADALTGLRTAAASAVATRALSRSDSRTLTLLGAGAQATWHLRLLPHVRPIDDVRVWSRDPDRARRFAREVGGGYPTVTPCETVEAAVADADIICTLTHARDPVLEGRWLRDGQHLNLVGASTAAFREVDEEAVRRCHLVVDSRRNAFAEAGELLAAIRAGVVTGDHVRGEIGEVLAHSAAGRSDAAAITAYKSLGHSAQDLAVSHAVTMRLDALGRGRG